MKNQLDEDIIFYPFRFGYNIYGLEDAYNNFQMLTKMNEFIKNRYCFKKNKSYLSYNGYIYNKILYFLKRLNLSIKRD